MWSRNELSSLAEVSLYVIDKPRHSQHFTVLLVLRTNVAKSYNPDKYNCLGRQHVWSTYALFWDFTQRGMVVTDVAGHPIGPVFKGQAVQEECPEHWGARCGRWLVLRERNAWPLKIGPEGCPETLVGNYYPSLRKIQKAQILFKPRRLHSWRWHGIPVGPQYVTCINTLLTPESFKWLPDFGKILRHLP
jgi:hypothetical protein